jgi:predicted GNAT family acetyltransferase
MSWVDSYKQYGWYIIPRGFKFLLRRIGILTESFYLLEYTINETQVLSKMKKYDYSDVRELSLNDFKDSNLFSLDKVKLFEARIISKNYSCFGIKCNNEIAYLTWISWKYMNYPIIFNKIQKLNDNEVLLEDSFCNPDFRGKGYHSKMNLFRLKKIKEMGKARVLALVLKENTPALKVQRKSGFRIVKKISFFKIGKWCKIKEKKYHDRD